MSTPTQPFEPSEQAWARVAAVRRRLTVAPKTVRAAVVGAGVSGLAALRLLKARGADVRMLDDRSVADLPAATRAELADTPVYPIEAATVDAVELVVLSPGVPRSRPALDRARVEGRLVGEVELASWFTKVPLIGITGTNGKSTTTALVAHLLEAGGRRVFAGGNLGRPLSELVVAPFVGADASEESLVEVAVVELSSYQLESVIDAHFRVACWLNLTPDHLDRYPDVATYAAAKRRLVERRSINGVAVMNADDAIVRDVGRSLGGLVRWFSVHDKDERVSPMGTFMSPDGLAVRRDQTVEETYRIDGPALLGAHNHANACAAIECARFLGATPDAVQAGLTSFAGLPHRLEKVGTVGSAVFFNDSKATNVDAAVTAVRAVPPPIVLIAGGRDKGGAWTPIVEEARGRVAAVIAIGEAADIVERAFGDGGIPVEHAGTLAEAVPAALRWAERCANRTSDLTSGQVSVLLAPACASFDQFASYVARGDAFRSMVQALISGEASK